MRMHDQEASEQARPAHVASWMPWIALVGAVAAGALGFWLGTLVASDGAGDETESTEAPGFVDQWGAAFVAGDPDALAGLYADGAAFSCRAFDFTINSEEIADVFMGDGTDFTEFKPTAVLVGDEIITVEYIVSATSPSGEGNSTPLIAVFDVEENGLIARSTIDYDRREMFPDQFPQASEQSLTALGCGGGA